MKPDKSAPDNQAQKEAVSSNGIGSSLSIGLSLGVLIGIIIDDIGLGMMLGVAVGLCIGPAVGVLGKNQKTGEQTSDDEKQFSAMSARKFVPQKHFTDQFPSFSTTEGCHLSIFHCMLETPKRRGGIQL